MTKRQALVAIFSLPLAAFNAFKVRAAGVLTIDLDQWTRIEIVHDKKTVVLQPHEIFQILKEGDR